MEINIKTNKREELIDITGLIDEKIKKFTDGVLHIFIPHATAGITINENADPNLPKDMVNLLNKLVPQGRWLHDRIDDNADAHIKSSIIGNSVSIPIKDGKMLLGTWQNIFLCEFDGPRTRRVLLNILST